MHFLRGGALADVTDGLDRLMRERGALKGGNARGRVKEYVLRAVPSRAFTRGG